VKHAGAELREAGHTFHRGCRRGQSVAAARLFHAVKLNSAESDADLRFRWPTTAMISTLGRWPDLAIRAIRPVEDAGRVGRGAAESFGVRSAGPGSA